MQWVIVYVLSIVAVNYGFSIVPLVELPWGELWPPMSLLVGLVFVFRDFAQRQIGHFVIIAMLTGGVLSYYMADPFIAIASVTAFLVSECADWAIYTITKKPFHQRILLSSLVSTPIDSAVFLHMIGHFSVSGVVVMTISKLIGAFIVWRMLRHRRSVLLEQE